MAVAGIVGRNIVVTESAFLPMIELAAKSFNTADQAHFAYVSGDTNPLHLDPIAARRTQMGACVVHGMHAALWALETACRRQPLSFSHLQIKFLAPIYVGETAAATAERRPENELRIELSVDGVLATAISLQARQSALFPVRPTFTEPERADWPRYPIELDLKDMIGQAGSFSFAHPADVAAEDFPALCRAISSERVAAMIALSRLVGMICPGLHSILQGCTLVFTETTKREVLEYSTVEVSERMRLVRLQISGPGIDGEVVAFRRSPPTLQPTLADIATRVPPSAYIGHRVLVVGGSRGLGEVTAKVCAAGGADVHITYAAGETDARRVSQEVSRHGLRCSAHRFDIRGDIRSQLREISFRPTHMYYFASPPIVTRHGKFMNESALAEFLFFFTNGFSKTCESLLANAADNQLRVFYPSSTSVTHPPRGFTEYAMAKAAGEALCRGMNAHIPGVQVIFSRLPRVMTDQTATIMSAQALPVLDVMLPVIAEVQEQSAIELEPV